MTSMITPTAYRAKIVPDSTLYGIKVSTNLNATGVPGFYQTSANTYIEFPVRRTSGGKSYQDVFFNIIFAEPCTGSTANYAAVAVQYRPSSEGGFNLSSGGSTKESAFKTFLSTGCFVATSTEGQMFTFGPVDTQTFGCIASATSSNYDKGDVYIRMMVGYSTATTVTLDALSTNAPVGCYFIRPLNRGL